MFVRTSLPLQSDGHTSDIWRSVSRIAYGQTAVVRNIFPIVHCAGVTTMSPHYNLSPAVKIYRRHLRVRSSSASQNDYRLVIIIVMGISIFEVGHMWLH